MKDKGEMKEIGDMKDIKNNKSKKNSKVNKYSKNNRFGENIIKINRRCMYTVAILCLVFISGCENKKNSYTDEYHIGIVETTGLSEQSFLTIYNDKLDNIGRVSISLGSLGSVSSYAKVYGNKVFMLPLGVTGKYEHSGIAEFDIATGKYKMHELKTKMMMDFEVDNKYIYAINASGSNGYVSGIIRYKREDGSIEKINRQDVVIDNIFLCGNKLYACGIGYDSNGMIYSKIFDINKNDFSITKEIDFTEYGIGVSDILCYNDKYYIALSTQQDEGGKSERKAESIIVMDSNMNFSRIRTGKQTSQLFEFGGEVFAACYDRITDRGNEIISIKGDAVYNNYYVDNKIRQVEVVGDRAVVLGENSIDEYDIKNSFFKINSTLIDKNINNKEGYFSTFFINK